LATRATIGLSCLGVHHGTSIVIVYSNNGAAVRDKFLDTIVWFQEWKKMAPSEDAFLPWQTYDSICNVSYGFACMIQSDVLEKGGQLVLKRINQDRCEHHFLHTRASADSHDNPGVVQARVCAGTSTVYRVTVSMG
jgi:hypothetical protein